MRVKGWPCLAASRQLPSFCRELGAEGSAHTEPIEELRPGSTHPGSHWCADTLGSSFPSSPQHFHFRTLGTVLSEVPHLQF